jgi:hypothetical protein
LGVFGLISAESMKRIGLRFGSVGNFHKPPALKATVLEGLAGLRPPGKTAIILVKCRYNRTYLAI